MAPRARRHTAKPPLAPPRGHEATLAIAPGNVREVMIRAMKVEVSLPTGSLSIERTAVGTALSHFPARGPGARGPGPHRSARRRRRAPAPPAPYGDRTE